MFVLNGYVLLISQACRSSIFRMNYPISLGRDFSQIVFFEVETSKAIGYQNNYHKCSLFCARKPM